MAETYKIIRHYQSGGSSVIVCGLTREEARAYCHDPETSSKTATSAPAREHTRTHGEWFDGYDEE